MRVLGPITVLGAILLFVFTLLAGCIVSLIWPLFALLAAVVAFSAFHPFVGWAFLRGVPAGFVAVWDVFGFAGTVLAHPLRPNRMKVPPSRRLPDLEYFVAQVAAQVGTKPFTDIVLVPEANLGVAEVGSRRGLRRVLIVGTPLLFVFTIDEMRAVVAHELGHVALGHTRWARVLGRWVDMITAVGDSIENDLNPMSWSLRFSGWVLRMIQGPWSRSEEYAADRFAVRAYGRDILVGALRKAHEQGNSLAILMEIVADRTETSGVGPESWTEAAFRAFEALPSRKKVELRRGLREDPFDVDGRTHPTFALRSRALAYLPKTGLGDQRRVISVLPDVLKQERVMTKAYLDARRFVPARDWTGETQREAMVAGQLEDIEAATGGYNEF